jgi:2-polyprenyl-3-methyl-5-hydroxy-6-metoxy-1,4-benzoquinol methylase
MIPLTSGICICRKCAAVVKENFKYIGYEEENNEKTPAYLTELNEMYAQHLLQFIMDSNRPIQDLRVLEIGCFQGDFLNAMLWADVDSVHGCDIADKTNGRFEVFPTIASIIGDYDVISMIHTIEHLPIEELHLLKKKIGTILNPGGIFYSVTNCTYPIETALYDMKEPTHHAFPTQQSYLQWLQFQGSFTMEEFENRWDYSSTCIMTKDI